MSQVSLFKRAKRRIEWGINDILFRSGIRNHLSNNNSGGRSLVYHGIDEIGTTRFNSRFISQNYFEKQIAFFKENFNVVSLAEYYQQNFAKDRLTVSITFDDGYANNLKYALPVLEKYNVPATFFITAISNSPFDILWADHLDLATKKGPDKITINNEQFRKKRGEYYAVKSGKKLKILCKERDLDFKLGMMNALSGDFKLDGVLSDYWRQLSRQEIRLLAQSPLVTIGSHGYYHNCLANIPFEDACFELEKSKSYLEDLIQREVKSIGYPDGSYNREIVNHAKKLGFKYQLAVEYLFEEDKYDESLQERFVINPYVSWENQLYYLFKGSY